MADIPETEPTEIIAGDTLRWNKTLTDYPADDGWVLKYSLRGPGVINIISGVAGSIHTLSVSAEDTADYIPGKYVWVAKVYKSQDVLFQRSAFQSDAYQASAMSVYTVGSGAVTITQNLEAVTGQIDLRSDAQIAYDNAMAIWKAVKLHGSYSIAGRTYTSRHMTEIIQLVEKCKRDLMAERMQEQYEKTGINPRHIKTRFNR